jgi:hypothetical protein
MGTVDQHRARADFCQRMAEKATGQKARATWLKLAANALAAVEQPPQGAPSFHPEGEYSVGQDPSLSGH